MPPSPPHLSDRVDRAWYLGRYPDVDPDADLDAHYDAVGWQAGRDPAPWFCTAAYLVCHPDVASAGVNPFAHWRDHGRAEGRAIFDAGTPLDLVRPRQGAPGDL
ncbi:MAG: hypothetical protein H7Z10_10095, partial [Gemmatimonadaceae bacterium]|nr:hypothetical protein [Acetobacteraceae bacterium]